MKRMFLGVALMLFASACLGGFIFLKELNVSFPEEMYKFAGTKTFIVRFFVLFGDEKELGIVFNGSFFAPHIQSLDRFTLKVETGESVHTFFLQPTRKGFYFAIGDHLLIVPKGSKVFLENQEIPLY